MPRLAVYPAAATAGIAAGGQVLATYQSRSASFSRPGTLSVTANMFSRAGW